MEANMAVPDPHVEEMHLMTFQPRPRTCKKPLIPRRQDYIEVMWCLDYLPGLPDRWCMAEVLHISPCSAQNIIAAAVLRYLPDESWDEEIHQVEFLEDHNLRRIADHTDIEESEGSRTVNPITKWRPAVSHRESSAPSDDKDWSISEQCHTSSMMDVVKSKSDEAYKADMQSLRAGYSALVVEVEKIKKELLNQSQAITATRKREIDNEFCSSAGCVLQRLRYRIGLRLQVNIRSMSASAGKKSGQDNSQTPQVRTGDGVHVGVFRTRVECTLHQFENVARRIKTNAVPGSVHFVPDFLHTQLPTSCSAAFRIMFKTFLGLASHVGVSSFSDVLEMARKCGTGPQGDVLRLMATYDYDENDPSAAARVFLGASCGKRQEPLNTDGGCEKKIVVLTRQSRKWNVVDHRFLHSLNMEQCQLPTLEDDLTDAEAFSLAWKRGTDLGPRTWSKSMTEANPVFGWLEVCLPYIQVEGQHLCSEIGALASDEQWEHMFGLFSG